MAVSKHLTWRKRCTLQNETTNRSAREQFVAGAGKYKTKNRDSIPKSAYRDAVDEVGRVEQVTLAQSDVQHTADTVVLSHVKRKDCFP